MKDKEGRKKGAIMCHTTTLFVYWILKQIIPRDIAKLIASKKK